MSEIEPLDDFERNILSIPHLTDVMRGDIIRTHRQGLERVRDIVADVNANLQARAEETARKNAGLRQKANQIIDDAVQRAGRDITAALEKVEAVKQKK